MVRERPMMIFNAVVIADCARRLWKFGVRTPMPRPPLQPSMRLHGFMLFSKEMRPYVERDDPSLTYGQVGKRLAELWRSLTDAEKAKYALPRRR